MPSGQWCVVRTPIFSVAPSSVRRAGVNGGVTQLFRLEEYLRLRSFAVACSSERELPVNKTQGNLQAPDAKPKRRRRNKGDVFGRPADIRAECRQYRGLAHAKCLSPCLPGEKLVRVFATFTEDLERLTDWLEQCGVTTVALEYTGVNWIRLFEILEQDAKG